MIQLFLLILCPFISYANPVDLLALKPTQSAGTVERSANGDMDLSAGFFGIAAIYQQIPLSGKSFDLTAVFTRVRGSDGVGLVFPVGADKVTAVFGGWGGQFDGLNRVDGLGPNDRKNPTSRASKIVNGDSIKIKISVRPERVAVYANNQLHFELDPRAHKVSAVSDISNRFQDGLGLYIVSGELSVESWSLEEIRP